MARAQTELAPERTITAGAAKFLAVFPIVDYHLIYALALIALAVTSAGHRRGLGKRWAKLPFVQRNRWLI